ncbi:MAG: uncharacterized protein JWM47_4075 [Acidimicrobiales bacterium]|nr:uncharacterized protein [Acidimicrobiales bacterium]
MSPATPASAVRLLVIEDEHRIVSLLEAALERAGFDTVSVGDGRSGLRIAQDPSIALVILDLGLPDLDGLEVLSELRRRHNRTPVIILSGRHDARDKVAGLEGGAQDYVTKPFSVAELVARVRLRLPAAPGRPAAGVVSPDDATAGARILVIEDDPRISSFLAKGLGLGGYQTVPAEDGEVGAFLAATEQFDLVVLDLGLPGPGGFSVLARLGRDAPDLPVMLLTGYDEPFVRLRALDAGAVAFFSKPLVFADFLETVRDILARGPRRPRPGPGRATGGSGGDAGRPPPATS